MRADGIDSPRDSGCSLLVGYDIRHRPRPGHEDMWTVFDDLFVINIGDWSKIKDTNRTEIALYYLVLYKSGYVGCYHECIAQQRELQVLGLL